MGNRRIVTLLAALLLMGSASLSYAAAWQRWGGFCGWGGVEDPACLPRQDHLYDALWPTAPWEPIGSMAQLLGVATVLQAAALVLLPAALGRRSSARHRFPLAIAAFVMTYVGVGTLVAGMAGHPVEPLGMTVVGYLSFFVMPVLIVMGLFTQDADGRRAGLRGGFVVWMLVMTAPIFQIPGWGPMFGGFGYDASPWHEAAVVPFLVAAAIALKPWSLTRSASRKHAVPSLALH